jgi:DAK2 domain fusion protein YloV
MSNGDSPTRLTGDDFRAMVAAGTRCLEQNADAINALNVFPVPDGDTGINMLLTLRSANDSPELPPAGSGTVAQVSHGLARGALLGARGNSGVIFSQFMKGLSLGLADCEDCGGADLGAALGTGSAGSYQAVGKPVEGTMLSVMRAAAEATEATEAATATPAEILRIALEAAQWALEHTPEQLPILKEAGVVDAGGQGVVAFLAGALGHLDGKDVHLEIAVPASSSLSSVSHDFLEHTEEEMYGYCTQFIIQGDRIDVDTVRERVMAMAGSTVVVGDDRTVRVHAHTEDPGPVLSLGTAYGVLDQINIQNMDQQHEQFMVDHGYKAKHQGFAIVAVAAGKGIESVFTDLGASAIVRGGQTMNASASELLEAARTANADHVVLLPNNPNIIMAANQAAELGEGTISVVPSRSIPQGIAGLLAFNPELDPDENIEAMKQAIGGVRSGEVTTAVRTTTLNDVDVVEGQAIALLDGVVVAAKSTEDEALAALVARAEPEADTLITLYRGANVGGWQAQASAAMIVSHHAGVEVEVVDGGQPHYHYLVSIE